MSVTIKELARACGVSPSTVSYVLNDGPRPVSARTRSRVLDAIQRLDYQPSAVARGLSKKRMNAVGVVIDFWYSPAVNTYFASVFHGVLAVNLKRKQSTTIFLSDVCLAAEHDVNLYTDGRCDGLLLIGLLNSEKLVPHLQERRVPFVLVNDLSADPTVSSVDIDNRASAVLAVERLLAAGHRRIAIFCGDSAAHSAVLRLAGYREALEAAGIVVDESLILPGTYSEETGYHRAIRILAVPHDRRPTAIFCADDAIALGAMRAFSENGVCVPDDISLVGIDDIPEAAGCNPPLTTVRQPLREIGEIATEILVDQIEGRAAPGRKVEVATELVERGSVAPRCSDKGRIVVSVALDKARVTA